MNGIATAHLDDSDKGPLQQIHDDLRLQHPEWIQPNGQWRMCNYYEARLM